MNLNFILSLLLVVVAAFKLTTSFMNPEQAVTLFGAEVNIWVFRLIWLSAGLLSLYAISRERKKLNNKKD